jgi:hypothetical protein
MIVTPMVENYKANVKYGEEAWTAVRGILS